MSENSKKVMVFDVETTGFVNTGDIAKRNRVVQIAWVIMEERGETIATYENLLQQSAPIPESTIAIHGKTDLMCQEQGIPAFEVINSFKEAMEGVDVLVGHNAIFDINFVKSEAEIEGVDLIFPKEIICTKNLYIDVLKMPATPKMVAAGRTGHKAPKLEEAYEMLFEVKFENAHDALADVQATADIYNEFFIRNMHAHFPEALKNARIIIESKERTASKEIATVEEGDIKSISPDVLFTQGGYDALKQKIENMREHCTPSLHEKGGKKDLISFAARFRKLKAPVKDILTAHITKISAPIIPIEQEIAKSKKFAKLLEDLFEKSYKEVRQPITELEEAQKKKDFELKEKINAIRGFYTIIVQSKEHGESLLKALSEYKDVDFGKFKEEAIDTYRAAYARIEDRIKILGIEQSAPKISPQWGQTADEAAAVIAETAAPRTPAAPEPRKAIDKDAIVMEFMILGASPDAANSIYNAIANGEIPHITLN